MSSPALRQDQQDSGASVSASAAGVAWLVPRHIVGPCLGRTLCACEHGRTVFIVSNGRTSMCLGLQVLFLINQFEADKLSLAAMGVARRSFAALKIVRHVHTASRPVRETMASHKL